MTAREEPAGAGQALAPTTPGWRRALRWLWVVLVLVALAVALASRWEEVRAQLALLDPLLLLAATTCGVLGVGLSAGIWRALLAGLGTPLGFRGATRVFFVGQLGKYLPGSLWPLVAQAELGRDHGVPARASLAAVGLFLWVHLLTGAAVAAVTLPLAGVLPRSVALLAPIPILLLAPGPLGWLLTRLVRLARRQPLQQVPDAPVMARAAAWGLAMWSAYALHLLLVVTALGEAVSLGLAAGAFAAAWCAGFLILIAPAGAGVREVVMVAALSASLTPGAALTVALASRLLLTMADLGWGITGLVTGRARRAPRGQR